MHGSHAEAPTRESLDSSQPKSEILKGKMARRAGFRVQGFGFRVLGLGFRVQGSGLRVPQTESLHPNESSLNPTSHLCPKMQA